MRGGREALHCVVGCCVGTLVEVQRSNARTVGVSTNEVDSARERKAHDMILITVMMMFPV